MKSYKETSINSGYTTLSGAPSFTQLRNLFDSLSDVVCAIDLDHNFVHVSKASFKMWGYEPEELIGKSFFDLISKKDKQRTLDAIDRVIAGAEINEFINHYHHKNGSIVPVSWSSKWDAKDKMLYCMGRDITEKQASEKLKENFQKQVADILERITDGFMAIDKDWKVIYWNHRAEQIVSRSRAEVLMNNLWDCFPGEVPPIYLEKFNQAMDTQQPVFFEAYTVTRPVLLEISVYPSPDGLSVFFKDITERKKTEEELSRLSLIAKETVNTVVISDLQKRVVWVNNAFTKLTGYTAEEAVGQHIGDLLDGPGTDKETLRYMHEQMAKGEPFHVEILNYTKEKTPYWSEVFCQPLYNDKGEIDQFFSIETNITERKKAEEELAKLSLISKETANMVILTDLDGHITWVNDAFTRVTGYSFDEAVGYKPGCLLQGEESDPVVVQFMREKVQKGEAFQVEIVNYRKTKEKYIVSIQCQPVYDKQGRLQQFFSVQKDITERRRLQEQLHKEVEYSQKKVTAAVIKAQEKERAHIGRELHDGINQVLTTVKLYNDLCLSGSPNATELLQKSNQLLIETIDEIRNLSNQLLSPTRDDKGLKDSLKDLVDSIVATHKLAVTLDAPDLESLHISKELHLAVYRIMQEHLTNVLKYASAETVEITIRRNNKALSILVVDDGVGFDVKTKHSGAGIANMTSRAESLNGSLRLISYPGNGCTLVASFPLL